MDWCRRRDDRSDREREKENDKERNFAMDRHVKKMFAAMLGFAFLVCLAGAIMAFELFVMGRNPPEIETVAICVTCWMDVDLGYDLRVPGLGTGRAWLKKDKQKNIK